MLKHRVTFNFPSLSEVPPEVRNVLSDFFREAGRALKNIYDDLVTVSVGPVDTLPTASEEYHGRYLRKANAGAEETLHVCLYDAGTSTYSWKQVTLT